MVDGVNNRISVENAPSEKAVAVNKALPVSADKQEYDELCAKFDEKRVKSLLRRVDMRLLPPLAILYLVSFIDRANIGNARLQNLEADLNLSPGQFNWYVVVAFPSCYPISTKPINGNSGALRSFSSHTHSSRFPAISCSSS